jgi:hypothetical protein
LRKEDQQAASFVVNLRNDPVSLAFCWCEGTVTHKFDVINAYFVGFMV